MRTATQNYRLGSSPLVFAPNVIRFSIEQFSFQPDWSVRMIADGWEIPEAAAKALVSKAVPYTIEGETVVFDA